MDRTTVRFWTCFGRLPEAVQRVARQNFELLKDDPSHPSLHFKKVGTQWSVRVGLNHRALAVEDGADYIWGWIGPHDEYERLIKQQGKGGVAVVGEPAPDTKLLTVAVSNQPPMGNTKMRCSFLRL